MSNLAVMSLVGEGALKPGGYRLRLPALTAVSDQGVCWTSWLDFKLAVHGGLAIKNL